MLLRDGEIAAVVTDWSGKDADRIAAHYAADGNVMIPNSPTITGSDTIGKTMRDALQDPNWSLTPQPAQVEVSGSGELDYTRGTYVGSSQQKSKIVR
jgi:ketosteroid isomerase-like protein